MTMGLCLFLCGLATGALTAAVLSRVLERDGFRRNRDRATANLESVLGLAATGVTLNGDLRLDFLTDLTTGMAAKLSLRRPGTLYLNGLITLSDEAAHALTHHRTDSCGKDLDDEFGDTRIDQMDDEHDDFQGLLPASPIDDIQAFMLDEDELDDGYIFGDEPAESAQQARPQNVVLLDGLTTLSANAARALAMHQGGLSLNGLTILSPEVAVAFTQHQGVPPDVHGCCETSPSDWSPPRFLRLNGLKTLSDAAAHELASYEGDLFLDGLTTLSEESARALASHRGRLSLSGLTAVSTEVATALAQHEGDVMLDGLATFSPDVAEAFAHHVGNLYLDGVVRLSDEAVDQMIRCNRTHSLFLRSLTMVSSKAWSLLQADHNIKLPSANKGW